MAAVIHGGSHKAMKYMRQHPATLSVYWVYCARMNYEAVSFPSLKGLVHDTGWSINECREARAWLVEHGALERIEQYVRPTWRKLPDTEKKRRLALDHSEYYRPTGLLHVKGDTIPLLYEAQRDSDPDDDVSPHDISQRTMSYASERRHGDTELDSIKELDSSKAERSLKEEEEELLPPLQLKNVFTVYENRIGLITPTVMEKIKDWTERVPEDWIVDAIAQAETHNKRSWAYVEAILKRQEVEGRANGTREGNNISARPELIVRVAGPLEDNGITPEEAVRMAREAKRQLYAARSKS